MVALNRLRFRLRAGADRTVRASVAAIAILLCLLALPAAARRFSEPLPPRLRGPSLVISAASHEVAPRLSAFGIGPATKRSAGEGPSARDPSVLRLLAAVDFDRCQRDLRRLTGLEAVCDGDRCGTIANRLTGSPGLELAMDYLLAELQSAGYAPEVEAWRGQQVADRNVLVRKTGIVSPTEEVFVVAHLDGVGSCPGQRCPAADDNGSGAVASLEVARVFAAARFARSVVVLFTTGEEQGMVGAKAFIARRGGDELAAIHSLINVDMLGYDGNGDRVMELYYGDHRKSVELAQRIRQTIVTYVPWLEPRLDPGCG